MCNRYKRSKPFNSYRGEFSQTKIPLTFPAPDKAPNDLGPEEIAPTDFAPIFRKRVSGDGIEMLMARWWLVPAHWKAPFKTFVKKAATFNARVETAATLPTFREAWRFGRCLIPADGWFEYTGTGKKKERWLIEPSDKNGLMFAGLYSRFDDPEAGSTETFSMVMQPAFKQVEHIHHRAPIPLTSETMSEWLEPEIDIKRITNLSHSVRLEISSG